MARISGFSGGMSGKIGNVVFSQRQGETIARQYQPQVTNPNTLGQQEARVSFKLMSQLGAIMAPAMGGFLANRKSGAKGAPSQRNLFFKKNYELVTVGVDDDTTRARIPMEQLQLTDSFLAAGTIDVAQEGNQITVSGTGSPGKRVKVVLVGFGTMAGAERPARVIDIIEEEVKDDGTWGVAFESDVAEKKGLGQDITVLSYGMIPVSERLRTQFDNIHTPEPFFSAVELTNYVSDGDMQVTETIGANFTIND